ncbi:MAG: ArnT family glycosyltransferase [Kofleriaceae bacterium]
MSADLAGARLLAPRRRPIAFEVACAAIISLAVLVPGIWKYTLVDPWETHYGEVARTMLQDSDFVHTKWHGTYVGNLTDDEGFRSKPVLMFWMMAAGMKAIGVAEHGGYSGEMTASGWTMIAIRLPFILAAVCGLVLMWWMLARLINRRLAWLALLVVGSAPMFCMIARTAIPDMPMVACTIGAVSLFLMAVEDGDRPIAPLRYLWRGRFALDARHVVLGIAGGFVLAQAIYYALYFTMSPYLGIRGRVPDPAIWLPAVMVLLLGGASRDGWVIVRLPFVLLGGVIAAIVNEPMPRRAPGQSHWRHLFDDVLGPWERHDPVRYLIRALAFPVVWAAGPGEPAGELAAAPATRSRRAWRATAAIADRALGMAPLTTMRQLYLIGMYFLLGVSVLAKGPPGLTVVAAFAAFYVLLFDRWRALYDGAFELKRGLLMLVVVALPWHVAMFLKHGPAFVNEYLFLHILNRAGDGSVDKSLGTFEHYTSQIGHGMWLWAALLPAALGAAMMRSRRDTREGRVRFAIALWAMTAVAVFCLVATKFNHYILPAIPPLCLVVAFFLDDLAARRDRLHPLYAALGIGIVLLICRDLMFEPDRWIEMFVYRDDRPWPSGEPWQIDPSDGFLGLAIVAAIGIAVAATRFVRTGVALICAAGLAICVWGLQIYMPHAGTHWGMREAVRTYYEQRTIFGEKLVYFSDRQLRDEWADVGNTWSFETFVPDDLQLGQPMTVKIQVTRPDDDKIIEHDLTLVGAVTAIGDHAVELTFAPGERAKLDPLLSRPLGKPVRPRRARLRYVDADKLVAWQLYWRGENFWSGGEIWGDHLDLKTAFPNTNNVEFNKFINDRTRAPLGRRYFVVGDAGRINSIRSSLPTERAKASFEVLDSTSNKFWLAAFYL